MDAKQVNAGVAETRSRVGFPVTRVAGRAEALRDLVERRHVVVTIDARSTVNANRASRSSCDAADERREGAHVERRERALAIGRLPTRAFDWLMARTMG